MKKSAEKETLYNLTKKDLAEFNHELTESIYLVGLFQALVIIGALFGIINFMINK